jgi:MarR family transcriptional regulator, organic hydroperoxide resistance regulator
VVAAVTGDLSPARAAAALHAWADEQVREDTLPGEEPLLRGDVRVTTAELGALGVSPSKPAEAMLMGDGLPASDAGLSRHQQFRLLLRRSGEARSGVFTQTVATMVADATSGVGQGQPSPGPDPRPAPRFCSPVTGTAIWPRYRRPRHSPRGPRTGRSPTSQLPEPIGDPCRRHVQTRSRGQRQREATHMALLQDDPCFALYVAARASANHYRPLLSELGLTYPQYFVMLVLWERGPLTVKDLGEALSLDSGTLSPLLKRLEDTGIVARQRGHSDGRHVKVSITPAGNALRDRARGIAESAREALHYSPEQYADLVRTLHELAGRLRVQ